MRSYFTVFSALYKVCFVYLV